MASFRPIGLFVAVVIILSTQTSSKPIEVTNDDNNRPIIGILAQEITPGLLPPGTKGQAYIAASYVKYIESAGGRVVPILTTFGEQELEELFPSLNGVLFPGGDANLFSSKYYKIAKFFHEKAVAANSKGDFFPIWGTCLGFQTLASITAGKQIVTPSNAVDISLPLNFSANAMESRMLKDAPKDIMMVLEKEPVTYNWHFNCVTPDTFSNNKELREGFRVLSYNNDIHGKKFISTMEGIKFPFYATQWHPEKNCFEWNPERHIAHSTGAIIIAQYFADFFVNEARKSSHHFSSPDAENKYLVYKYKPVFTGMAGHFEQSYLF